MGAVEQSVRLAAPSRSRPRGGAVAFREDGRFGIHDSQFRADDDDAAVVKAYSSILDTAASGARYRDGSERKSFLSLASLAPSGIVGSNTVRRRRCGRRWPACQCSRPPSASESRNDSPPSAADASEFRTRVRPQPSEVTPACPTWSRIAGTQPFRIGRGTAAQRCIAFHVVQLLPDSPDASRYASHASWPHRSRLGD